MVSGKLSSCLEWLSSFIKKHMMVVRFWNYIKKIRKMLVVSSSTNTNSTSTFHISCSCFSKLRHIFIKAETSYFFFSFLLPPTTVYGYLDFLHAKGKGHPPQRGINQPHKKGLAETHKTAELTPSCA